MTKTGYNLLTFNTFVASSFTGMFDFIFAAKTQKLYDTYSSVSDSSRVIFSTFEYKFKLDRIPARNLALESVYNGQGRI